MSDKECIYLGDAIRVAMQYCPDDDGTCSKAGCDLRELLDDIENLPAAPVREVVTCGECFFWQMGGDGPMGWCAEWDGSNTRTSDFCSRGKRPEGEGP